MAAAAASISHLSSLALLHTGSRYGAVALAKNERTQKRKSKTRTPSEVINYQKKKGSSGEGFSKVGPELRPRVDGGSSSVGDATDEVKINTANGLTSDSTTVAERGAVLKACIGTSAGLAGAGFLVRQVSHSAVASGWSFPDCTVLMPYTTEAWHVIPTAAVVVLVASLREILLKVWPEFAQSSERANKQVLGSLKPIDYFTVAYLSGISEELLFRGALLPLLGPDWRGVVGAGVIFGALHLTGGRNNAFAIWASLVGIVYGVLGLYTSDLAAPMAAHSAANLIGAALWKINKENQDSQAS